MPGGKVSLPPELRWKRSFLGEGSAAHASVIAEIHPGPGRKRRDTFRPHDGKLGVKGEDAFLHPAGRLEPDEASPAADEAAAWVLRRADFEPLAAVPDRQAIGLSQSAALHAAIDIVKPGLARREAQGLSPVHGAQILGRGEHTLVTRPGLVRNETLDRKTAHPSDKTCENDEGDRSQTGRQHSAGHRRLQDGFVTVPAHPPHGGPRMPWSDPLGLTTLTVTTLAS